MLDSCGGISARLHIVDFRAVHLNCGCALGFNGLDLRVLYGDRCRCALRHGDRLNLRVAAAHLKRLICFHRANGGRVIFRLNDCARIAVDNDLVGVRAALQEHARRFACRLAEDDLARNGAAVQNNRMAAAAVDGQVAIDGDARKGDLAIADAVRNRDAAICTPVQRSCRRDCLAARRGGIAAAADARLGRFRLGVGRAYSVHSWRGNLRVRGRRNLGIVRLYDHLACNGRLVKVDRFVVGGGRDQHICAGRACQGHVARRDQHDARLVGERVGTGSVDILRNRFVKHLHHRRAIDVICRRK